MAYIIKDAYKNSHGRSRRQRWPLFIEHDSVAPMDATLAILRHTQTHTYIHAYMHTRLTKYRRARAKASLEHSPVRQTYSSHRFLLFFRVCVHLVADSAQHHVDVHVWGVEVFHQALDVKACSVLACGITKLCQCCWHCSACECYQVHVSDVGSTAISHRGHSRPAWKRRRRQNSARRSS